MCRCAGYCCGRRARSGRALLYRCRRDAEPGRLAEGRRHPARTAKRPPAICNHVVFSGGCVNRHLFPLPPPACEIGMIAYRQLETRFRRIGAIEQAIAMLHWDAAAIMPAGGTQARAEQQATLRVVAHEELTAPELDDLVVEAERKSNTLDAWQRANLREIGRRRKHAAALWGSFVEAGTRPS